MEPQKFSQLGYNLILVGFVLIILHGLYLASTGSGVTSWVFTFLYIGRSLVLAGAIFAAAGHLTEQLRPAKSQP